METRSKKYYINNKNELSECYFIKLPIEIYCIIFSYYDLFNETFQYSALLPLICKQWKSIYDGLEIQRYQCFIESSIGLRFIRIATLKHLAYRMQYLKEIISINIAPNIFYKGPTKPYLSILTRSPIGKYTNVAFGDKPFQSIIKLLGYEDKFSVDGIIDLLNQNIIIMESYCDDKLVYWKDIIKGIYYFYETDNFVFLV